VTVTRMSIVLIQ